MIACRRSNQHSRVGYMHVMVVVLVGAVSIGIYAILRAVLPAAGWALVISERGDPRMSSLCRPDAEGAGVFERR